jgi:beta-lactamase regulating signal transducer with metallopeptidase domain
MTLFSLQTLHAIGWTLLHFVWQGAALAALLGALLMTSRNANVRYMFGIATLILMMAAPVVTFFWLDHAATTTATIEMSAAASVHDPLAQAVPSSEGFVHALAAEANRQDLMLWLVQAWFVGVMLLSARTAGGLLWLARARRGSIAPLSDEMYRQCLVLQRRMGLHRRIRYGQCSWLDAPAVLGWFQPIVLVTAQAMTGLSPQQLQAIIAHELAHIRRFDAFVNLFQIAAEMLLFYHPAVWWVSRRIRIEREVCCDHAALAACGEPVSYARALTLMEEWRTAPSLLMAANRGPLAERVLRLLGLQGTSARSRLAGVGVSITCVAAALFAGNVLVAAAGATEDVQAPSDTIVAAPEVETAQPVVAPAPTTPPAPVTAPPAQDVRAPKQVPPPPAAPEAPDRPAQATPKRSSYIKSLAAAGLSNLTADELIAMKIHGVTADYVDQTRRFVVDPSIDDLIAMKVHGITPQFIREIQSAGLDTRVANDFIAARLQGITPEVVKSAIDQGFGDLTLDRLVMLRNTGVI